MAKKNEISISLFAYGKMKTLKFLAILVSISALNLYAQDSSVTLPPNTRIGVGLALTQPMAGPQVFVYHRGLSLQILYGLPSSSPNTSLIRETDYGIRTDLSLTVAALKNRREVKGQGFYWPIVIGLGWSYMDEKDEVKGFTGPGSITGFHFDVGFQMLSSENPFFNRFVPGLYLGFNKWNYSNSVLEKNNSGLEYKYKDLDFRMSISYCFL